MEQELAYSFHLGSDKNKSKLAKRVSKDNVSGTTSLSNNAIQNANDLSRVNKHNLRDYDKNKELIRVIYGTDNIINDVKDLYLKEFEESKIDYNNKQTREDRKIKDYFKKVCESQNDIACEIIIELGDMDFWNDKDQEYRLKMIDVYNEQIKDLTKIVPTFKKANVTPTANASILVAIAKMLIVLKLTLSSSFSLLLKASFIIFIPIAISKIKAIQ